MISAVVWTVLAFVAILLGINATCFSLRTVRWAATIIALLLAGAITRYGLTGSASPGPSLVNAFTSGADRLMQALLQPLWPGHEIPAPGPVGWGVFAFLLLMGYRGLEWWALRRQAPLLDTSRMKDGQPSIRPAGGPDRAGDGWTDGQRHEQLAAELKFRLCAMEIRAPAILPGGRRTNGSPPSPRRPVPAARAWPARSSGSSACSGRTRARWSSGYGWSPSARRIRIHQRPR